MKAWRGWWLMAAALLLLVGRVAAAPGEGDITLRSHYWIDADGRATIDEVARDPARFKPMERHQSFKLGDGAMWMRLELPTLDPAHRWLLLLSGSTYLNRATLYLPAEGGGWREQRAGDQVPVAQWDHPHFSPLFGVPAGGTTAWLRMENRPAPASPFVQLVTDEHLQFERQWTFLLLGGYLGFCFLVFIVALIHARLYGDLAFDVYCLYVACMMLFQLAYTGLGGLFLWPHWAGFNDAAPAVFMLLMVASGIWFVRESTALQRHSRRVDRAVLGFSLFGAAFAPLYTLFSGPFVYAILNVYGLVSVVLSISLCYWTWRRGESYSGWLLLGFLPIHLAYPFPALRAAGLVADSWASQYAVLIGSFIEIPLLLYVLHWRAKDFNENRARLRALESTDPLTGLTVVPVLRLRLRDALRRARRSGQRCVVLLVDLTNHAEILQRAGREAADRALVVAGSRLTSVVREVDTVCRVAETRFAILSEGPQVDEARRLLAQHAVARGLERVHQLPPDMSLRFRIVSAWVPDGAIELAPDGNIDEQRLLQRLNFALDQLLLEPKKVVHHLDARAPDAQQTEPAPA